MGEFPKLETKRLELVQIDHKYDKDLYEILSMDRVTIYYGKESLESLEEAKEMIDGFYHLFRQKRSIRWGIIWKETGQFLGTVGLNNLNLWNKKGEIGYELHPAFWRRGITLEAAKKVLAYSFHELNLFRIGAVTFPQNTASNQLLKKLGFKQEGLLRGYLHQNNQSHDAIMHSLLKPEWSVQNEAPEIEERLQYTDHMTAIIRKAEREGQFDYLPGKGKPLKMAGQSIQSEERQLYKTLKDNHILPKWVKLAKEIDILKEELKQTAGREKRKLVKEVNKKIREYNYACPPSLQKRKVVE